MLAIAPRIVRCTALRLRALVCLPSANARAPQAPTKPPSRSRSKSTGADQRYFLLGLRASHPPLPPLPECTPRAANLPPKQTADDQSTEVSDASKPAPWAPSDEESPGATLRAIHAHR